MPTLTGTYVSTAATWGCSTALTSVTTTATCVTVNCVVETYDDAIASYLGNATSYNIPHGFVCTPSSITRCTTTGGNSWRIQLSVVSGSGTELYDTSIGAINGDWIAVQGLANTINHSVKYTLSAPLELTPEQLAIQEERQRAAALEREAALIRQREARVKAIQLLWNHLDYKQRHSLKKHGWFNVTSKTGQKYRLLYCLHGNVFKLKGNGQFIKAFCGHMGGDIPIADTLLAQKFLLTHNPDHYEQKANPINPAHGSWCRPLKDCRQELEEALESWSRNKWALAQHVG